MERIVLVSIIGIDDFTEGYQAAKQIQERETLSGTIPAQILRAAQFHEFVEGPVEWGTQDGVSYVPKMRTQLVAARTVAEELADLATTSEPGAPGSISEIAGPREENMVDDAKLLVERRGKPARVEAVSNPDDPATHLYEQGALLPGPVCHSRRPDVQAVVERTGRVGGSSAGRLFSGDGAAGQPDHPRRPRPRPGACVLRGPRLENERCG